MLFFRVYTKRNFITRRSPRTLLPRFHRNALDVLLRSPLTPRDSPLTHIESTLTRNPASVASKGLTDNLSLLNATLTKNRGEGFCPPSVPDLKLTMRSQVTVASGSLPARIQTMVVDLEPQTPAGKSWNFFRYACSADARCALRMYN